MSKDDHRGRLLTPRQVADRLRVSLSLVYQLCRELRLRHCRFGAAGKRGGIRIEEEEVERFKEESYRANSGRTVADGMLQHLNLD